MKKRLSIVFLVLLLLSIPVVSSPDFDGTLSVFRVPPFLKDFLRYLLSILFFFINFIALLPYFYAKKKYFSFVFFTLLFFLSVITIPNFVVSQFSSPYLIPMHETKNEIKGKHSKPMDHHESLTKLKEFSDVRRNDDAILKRVFISLLPFSFAFLSSFLLFKNSEHQELEKAKNKAELLNLKYQLQPHFLFNILNSVYSLTLMKSDDAPNSILKLSNVMRYIVQESGEDTVELKKEIEFLKDYIALQLLRTDESLDFSYTETGTSGNLTIVNHILINFIENAFKYGFNPEEKSKITIHLNLFDHKLKLKVYNKIVNREIDRNNVKSTNIGLKNTIVRLKHFYPKKHHLEIDDNGQEFQINLQIELNH